MREPLYLVTGGAGFIGSQLVARLLRDGGRVRVLDNFSTGTRANLAVPPDLRRRLEVVRGDVRDLATVARAARGARVVFHQAAMRSVPRSIKDPLGANANNVTGTLHVLEAARRARVPRVVYASSSSVYGDRPELPKREEKPTKPVSPYAVSKVAGELYASVWSRLFAVEAIGLRYFNVFGPRQDPKSEYAAVIPRFIMWALRGRPLEVHGDGRQSRDFTYIDNVVEANVLAGRAAGVAGEVCNVGCGPRGDGRRPHGLRPRPRAPLISHAPREARRHLGRGAGPPAFGPRDPVPSGSPCRRTGAALAWGGPGRDRPRAPRSQ